MLEILNSIDGFIWGPPLMILLMGTGILMSVRLGLLQVMKLPKALQLIFTARSKGEGFRLCALLWPQLSAPVISLA